MVFNRSDALEEHIHKHVQSGGGKRRKEPEDEAVLRKRQKLQSSPSDFYKIEKLHEKKIEKFKSSATYYKIYFNDLQEKDLVNILKILKQMFHSIIQNITEDIAAGDLIRVVLDNPQLDFPIVLPFMKKSQLTVDRLLSEIERVLQSYEQFVLDETLTIELVHVHVVTGSGYRMKPVVDISQMVEKKQSIIQIKNKDKLCCARALVTAIARIEKHPQWNSIRQGRGIQRELATNLHKKAGIPLEDCGIEEIKKFQSVLLDYQIHVISKEHFNAIVYRGPEGGIPIYLYHHDNHYDIITKMTGFLNRNFFCDKCKKGYDHKHRHACNNPCHFCRKLHPDDESEAWQYCEICNCKFLNQTCFEKHKTKTEHGQSTCEQFYRCRDCNQLINRSKHRKAHLCGETYCKTCKDYYTENHLCYMIPVEAENDKEEDEEIKTRGAAKKRKEPKYIFFDFECTQDNKLECVDGYVAGSNNVCVNCKRSWCGSMEHTPNLCVAHRVCTSCMVNDVTPRSECKDCGPNEKVFSGLDAVNLFCQWLFSNENKGATVICHNFKGYDSYPILKYLHQNAILPEVITTGSKYMSIAVPVCNIRFIDSLNFIPMALADMPEAFDETELAKGYFPHLYNTRENQYSILSHLPDIKYYNPDGMKPDTRQKFLQWYELHAAGPFELQKDLLRYCRSDVDVLRKCCLKFRSLFRDLTKTERNNGIDPFEKCITIASACNLVFRTLFLEPDTIGIIPPHGYRPEAKQSIMAYQWLSYLSYHRKVNIQQGRNIGEKQIGPYKLDGYYETSDGEKVALEFHGCFWHGCPKCFSKTSVNPVSDQTMTDLYDKTIEKKLFVESQGYTYECIWECEFKTELLSNSNMRQFINSLEVVTPLEPRDAFYGGRTEAFKLYAEATPEQQIRYYDVTSLYPFINKTGKIPVGHPQILTENFDDIHQYEGLIKCKVLPPRKLYAPVLPAKCNGKLIFGLCRTCSESYQSTPCKHCENERAFIGTWVTDEIKVAVAQGYEIVKIYEIWHFDEISQYDTSTKTGGLFTEYVNMFLKVKQEASGWPKWCKTEEQKQQYIHLYSEKEGIKLEFDKIQDNPGLRLLSKIMLNSFWGKFGQRPNLTQTTYLDDPVEFIDMMTSDQQEVKNVRFINDNSVQLDWVYSNDFVEATSRTNVIIAAYTTAQARLKLYSYLHPLGERIMYCDTDSVVFTSKQGDWEPPLGDFLGDLTDEAPNNQITKFVTGGPKNYAYCLAKPNKKGQLSICKVRGITLNFKNSIDINFKSLAQLVTGEKKCSSIKVTDENKIMRNPDTCNIITKTESKDYRIVYDKRVLSNKYDSFPYGY